MPFPLWRAGFDNYIPYYVYTDFIIVGFLVFYIHTTKKAPLKMVLIGKFFDKIKTRRALFTLSLSRFCLSNFLLILIDFLAFICIIAKNNVKWKYQVKTGIDISRFRPPKKLNSPARAARQGGSRGECRAARAPHQRKCGAG